MTLPLSVGIAVITYKAIEQIPLCLPPLLASSLKPRVLVVNSSSNDGTVELAQSMGAETLVVPRQEFNHGITRELARKYLQTDIVVMTTPDAICVGPETIECLIRPIVDGSASVSYARQLPHDGATFFEAFPRLFNYPDRSEIRSLKDLGCMGPYVFFCSDSCAAWSNKALDEIGGFEWTLTAEDTLAAAKLIHRGHSVAYAADALVKHSHRYTLVQEFKRYFDTGLIRSQYRDLFLRQSRDEARGSSFFQAMIRELFRARPYLIPYAILQTTMKYLGYRIGFHAAHMPIWLKARLSSQDYFWQNSVRGGQGPSSLTNPSLTGQMPIVPRSNQR
jgi:rhamnosyltransferase